MFCIEAGSGPQTVITTFDVTPGTCGDLLDALRAVYAEVITRAPGFLGGAIHVNDAQTRVCSYSRWQRREDFLAMLRSPEMTARSRALGELSRNFEPVLYEVVDVFGKAT